MPSDLTSSPVGGPYDNAEAVTVSAAAFDEPSFLYVGTSGSVTVTTKGGQSVSYAAYQGWLPVRVTAFTAGTATDVVRHW